MKIRLKIAVICMTALFLAVCAPAQSEEISIPTGNTPSKNVIFGPTVQWNQIALNKKPALVSQSFVMKSDWANNLHVRGTICWSGEVTCDFDVAFSIGTYWKAQPNIKFPMVRFDMNDAVEVKGNCRISKPDLQGNANKSAASCINYLPWVKDQAFTFVLADNTSLSGDWWDVYINITTAENKQTTKFPMGSIRVENVDYKALAINNSGWVYDAPSCDALPDASFELQEPKSSAGLALLRTISTNGSCGNITTPNPTNLSVGYKFAQVIQMKPASTPSPSRMGSTSPTPKSSTTKTVVQPSNKVVVQSKPTASKKTTPAQTVICRKGNQSRVFTAKSCPPGWKAS